MLNNGMLNFGGSTVTIYGQHSKVVDDSYVGRGRPLTMLCIASESSHVVDTFDGHRSILYVIDQVEVTKSRVIEKLVDVIITWLTSQNYNKVEDIWLMLKCMVKQSTRSKQ